MALMKYFQPDSKCVSSSSNAKATEEMMLLQEKVFENPVILQVILKHVLRKPSTERKIWKKEGTLCSENAKNLRLVSRAWLFEVNLLFRKCGQPLMCLTTKNLDKFLASTPKEMNNWIPPLSLSLMLETFSFKCISFPRKITWMELHPPRSLANFVLHKSEILETMKVLKLNIIPKYDLVVNEDITMLSKCLNLVALSLEELELGVDWPIFILNKDLRVPLNLPRMSNLKKLKIQRKVWSLDGNSMEVDLGGRLPNLEELEFQLVAGDTFFEDWCRNSVYWNVKSLKLSLSPELDDPVHNMLYSVETMQQIHETFPRVVTLQIWFMDVVELGGLKYIFGHMDQLESLNLFMLGEILSEEEIDGLFIGAEPEMVGKLKEDPTLWRKFLNGDLKDEGVCTSSIRNLKKLESLTLDGRILQNSGQGRRVEYMKEVPSDLAFELGFMQTPSLCHLSLEGSFGMSKEIADKWYKHQRRREISKKGNLFNGWIWPCNTAYWFYCVPLITFFLGKFIGRKKFGGWFN